MDVKTTFLHGDLEEEIYMKQPEGFVVKGKKELVCKMKKSLYGLKQSPRMWYQKFDTYMLGLGFTRSKEDHCVYFKLIGDHLIYLVLYVDDMLLIGNNKEIIQDVKTQLSSKFDMKDLGAANFILGMEIKRDRKNKKLWLNQRKYVETILQRFNMQECKRSANIIVSQVEIENLAPIVPTGSSKVPDIQTVDKYSHRRDTHPGK
jgi:hypothetical protein